MGLAENRAKAARLAKYLVEQGYPHGKRRSKPRPNSGGLTMTAGPGSAKYQRYLESKLANPKYVSGSSFNVTPTTQANA